MKFKNKQDYENQRIALMNEAKELRESGDVDAATNKLNDVEELDNTWSEHCKAIANDAALNDRFSALNMGARSTIVTSAIHGEQVEFYNENKEDVYLMAWAKDMLSQPMTNEERQAFDLKNAALSTETHGILIPETVVKGIFKEVGEMYPLWEDVTKTYVKGTLTMIKGETSTDAKWYDEETAIEDGN